MPGPWLRLLRPSAVRSLAGLLPAAASCAILAACAGGLAAGGTPPGSGASSSPLLDSAVAVAPDGHGTLLHDTVFSPALVGNRLGDSPRRAVDVYLPPSYGSSPRRRYPVIYLLHGFDADQGWWSTPRVSIRTAMDSLVAAGRVREAILVMPDAFNAYAGSFYVNSPTAGRWEDFVSRDLVRYVDGRYRTVAGPAARGVGGYSMGGYGAFTLAARHPDVFGAVYGLSACCMGGELLDDAGMADTTWARTLALRDRAQVRGAPFFVKYQVALASVLSPDPARAPLGVDFPFALDAAGRVVPVEPVRARWTAPTPERFVRREAAGLRRLRGIAFDVGSRDGLRHIPVTMQRLSRALDSAGIPHTFQEYDGTHGSHVPERIRTHMLPFLSAHLAP